MPNPKASSWKVWSGRIQGENSRLMEAFSSSIEVDRRMWTEDIAVNKAWAKALAEIGIYSKNELSEVLTGLDAIAKEFENNGFEFLPGDEDIHVAIERRLTEMTGDAGARIHTGRSRNDQVATDTRLYLKRQLKVWHTTLVDLQEELVALAQKHIDVVMPGYTHLQQAQPILLSHYLLAIFWGVDRTLSRMDNYQKRLDIMPLGAGALAGSAFPIDRRKMAARLGFAKIAPNSIDATGDRDFCVEMLFIIGAFFTHLSRVCAELQLWSSSEYKFIEFSDAFATGSSMMPQKKNPDAIELVRGKAAAAIAATNQVLILQKGLPLTYNRDLQEDKFMVFRQLDEVLLATKVFHQVVATAHFNPVAMANAIDNLTLATDLADYLVRKNVPFRKAHEIAGLLVRKAIEGKISLNALPFEEFQAASDKFKKDICDTLTVQAGLEFRNIPGGAGKEAVKKQITEARGELKLYRAHFAKG